MSIVSNLLRSAPPPALRHSRAGGNLAPVKLGLTHACFMLSEAR